MVSSPINWGLRQLNISLIFTVFLSYVLEWLIYFGIYLSYFYSYKFTFIVQFIYFFFINWVSCLLAPIKSRKPASKRTHVYNLINYLIRVRTPNLKPPLGVALRVTRGTRSQLCIATFTRRAAHTPPASLSPCIINGRRPRHPPCRDDLK